MARVKAPLFSFDAHGALADTLIYQKYKNIDTARSYFVPTVSNEPVVVLTRDTMAASVHASRNYVSTPAAMEAWRRALRPDHFQSAPVHLQMRHLARTIRSTPAASFATAAGLWPGPAIHFDTVNVDDGTPGDEAGSFTIWAGPTLTSLVPIFTGPLVAGGITSGATGNYNATTYVRLMKSASVRSGIFKLTAGPSGWSFSLATTGPNTSVRAACCSASGQYVGLGEWSGQFWRSIDYGATYNLVASSPNTEWRELECDATGQYMIMVSSLNRPKYSTDFGETWTDCDVPTHTDWTACAMSRTSGAAKVVGNLDFLWEASSVDSTFASNTGIGNKAFSGVSCSDDLTKIIIATGAGWAQKSTDSGSSWIPIFFPPGGPFWPTLCTGDGVNAFAFSLATNYRRSTDSFGSFDSKTGPSSLVGTRPAIARATGYLLWPADFVDLYVSGDLGDTWTVEDFDPGYYMFGGAMSDSGTFGFIGANNRYPTTGTFL